MAYNGWKNYETWCVNLWLSNDEGLYNDALEMARDVRAAYTLAESYREWVDELCELICPGSRDGATFVVDLLGAALSQVDWYEIAQSWIRDTEDGDA